MYARIGSMAWLAVLSLALAMSCEAQQVAIRIAYPSGMNGQIPVVMDKAGIAGQHGLNATFTGFQYGPPMMEALVSGQVDAVVTSLLPPATLSAKLPGSVAIVATLGNSSYSLLAPKGNTATRIADLRQRKIGVSFSTESHLDLLIALKAEGLDPANDVQLVNLAPNELPIAFEQGLVDAVVIRQPQTLRLEESLGARNIVTWPFYFISIVRTDYQQQHPDAVQRYVEALKESVAFIIAKPEQASIWFGENQRIDPAVVRRVSADNPLYTVEPNSEVSVAIGPAFRRLLDDRLEAIYKFGFTRDRVSTEALLADHPH